MGNLGRKSVGAGQGLVVVTEWLQITALRKNQMVIEWWVGRGKSG